MRTKRLLTLCAACLVLLISMMTPARADASFGYLDENGDLRQQAVAADHVIGGGWDASSDTLTGWYAVTGTLTIGHTLRVEGAAHLILTDGASLTVNASTDKSGIEVSEGNSLSVYAQSAGIRMGSLTANGGRYSAGIGGARGGSYQNGQNCGEVTINGGAVTATSDGGTCIGGGAGGVGPEGGSGGQGGNGGVVTINGGTVTANNHSASAIGGGEGGFGSFTGVGGDGGRGGDGSTVTINGGTVTATSFYSTGIGGGNGGYVGRGDTGGAGYYGGGGGNGGIVTINGGVVTASSTYDAGIGGGDGEVWGPANHYGGNGGTVTVNGGTVTGSTIGMGGARGRAGTVEINGGSVTGWLSTGWYSAGGTVTIRGGRVNSTGIANGLYGYNGGTVMISGGTVNVGSDGIANGTVGGSVIISGGSVNSGGGMGSTPKSGSGNGNREVVLTRVQLENVNLETAVASLAMRNAEYYGTNDLYTDASGILYLYLPSGASAVMAQTAEQTYAGSVASGTSGVLVKTEEPVVIVQPSDRTVTVGQKATFTVEAVGPGTLRYQWYVNREGAKGWAKINAPSARTDTYTTSALEIKHNGYAVACLVENGAGSVRSAAATLTVIGKSPETGDDSNLYGWIALLLLSGLALVLLLGKGGFRRC